MVKENGLLHRGSGKEMQHVAFKKYAQLLQKHLVWQICDLMVEDGPGLRKSLRRKLRTCARVVVLLLLLFFDIFATERWSE